LHRECRGGAPERRSSSGRSPTWRRADRLDEPVDDARSAHARRRALRTVDWHPPFTASIDGLVHGHIARTGPPAVRRHDLPEGCLRS
jgi:hypothetical protein